MKIYRKLLFFSLLMAMYALFAQEDGVSFTLAKDRAVKIQRLHYQLHFFVPSFVKDTISGIAQIEFELKDTTGGIYLDFAQDSSYLQAMIVNRKICSPKLKNQHIFLPSVFLQKGYNCIQAKFKVSDRYLNRREDFLYTLLVPDKARTIFPCFDQPNIKAAFSLILDIPITWKAVGNEKVISVDSTFQVDTAKIYYYDSTYTVRTDTLFSDTLVVVQLDTLLIVDSLPALRFQKSPYYQRIHFKTTPPLPTYLFAFSAGVFNVSLYEGIHIFHREEDSLKIVQIEGLAKEASDYIRWMENYTAVAYPFSKYDMVILPGFQYGGMEHPGVNYFADSKLFLSNQPTYQEKMDRSKLIAHEVAHTWFGDLVTMQWFNEVWLKEVFANYFASKMINPLYPSISHHLRTMTHFYPSAYQEDRTSGSNPIAQNLENLKQAGLLYGNIIYDKSPIVMSQLVDKIGEEAFQQSVRNYLSSYAFGNATWNDFVNMVSRYSGKNIQTWNHAWVEQKGMPHINVKLRKDSVLIWQEDPFKRGIYWEQPLRFIFQAAGAHPIYPYLQDTLTTYFFDFSLGKDTLSCKPPFKVDHYFPNADGKGYAYFVLLPSSTKYLLNNLDSLSSDTLRLSVYLNLYENLLHGNLAPLEYFRACMPFLHKEKNSILFVSLLENLKFCYEHYPLTLKEIDLFESTLWKIVYTHSDTWAKIEALRALYNLCLSSVSLQKLYTIWSEQKNLLDFEISERDWMNFSYQLAIRLPAHLPEIISVQRSRLQHIDRIKEFDFIVPALSVLQEDRDAFFQFLLIDSNRLVEPWVLTSMKLLNHPLRQKESVKYILTALEKITEIQQTGDIFFPKQWAMALLSGHHSLEAREQIALFWQYNRGRIPENLGLKIRQASAHLYWGYTVSGGQRLFLRD